MNKITINDFTDYEGIDSNIDTSLFEYGLIWKFNSIDQDYHFIYRVCENTYNTGWIKDESDFDWININDILRFMGINLKEWQELSIPLKVFYVVNYYGIENMFGASYGGNFEIIEED